ncbi:hypothetical protein [Actinomyces faecalis]|uniref:hypothetical protein n=1 Tax=Actinomyces faecalis TaxID=2722820 RepID=UPI0015561365|nr:hypothetical protein [Actinomyces faecalis]
MNSAFTLTIGHHSWQVDADHYHHVVTSLDRIWHDGHGLVRFTDHTHATYTVYVPDGTLITIQDTNTPHPTG